MSEVTENKNKNLTANASDVNVTPKIFTLQEAYTLDQTRYRILRKEESSWKDWTTRFLFVFIGSLITLLAKVLGKLANQEPLNLEKWYIKWEVWVCILSLLAFVITLLISCCSRSERKLLISEIDEHFKKSKSLIKVENQL